MEQFEADKDLIGDIEDLFLYKEELKNNGEEGSSGQVKETYFEKDNLYDDDVPDSGLLFENKKRFDSFFDQRAREKLLFQNMKSNLVEDGKDDTIRKIKVKRSRESTLKQLIKLCRKSDEEKHVINLATRKQMNNTNRMMRKFSTAPVYRKRFGSFFDLENRANCLLKKVNFSVCT